MCTVRCERDYCQCEGLVMFSKIEMIVEEKDLIWNYIRPHLHILRTTNLSFRTLQDLLASY